MLGDHMDLGHCLCALKSSGSPISAALVGMGFPHGTSECDFIWKYGCTSEILQVQFETRVETVRG